MVSLRNSNRFPITRFVTKLFILFSKRYCLSQGVELTCLFRMEFNGNQKGVFSRCFQKIFRSLGPVSSLSLLLIAFSFSGAAHGNETPRVLVFAGNPGDEEHHATYEGLLGSLSATFIKRFGIPQDRLTVLYGPKEAGYAGVCDRENLKSEMSRLRAACEAGDQSPVWIILIGHANKVRGGALLNLPGPDISMRDLGREVAQIPKEVPVVVWGTNTLSQPLIRAAKGPQRAVVSATGPKDPENETEFPLALAAALKEEATDTDGDGRVTVPELFLATRSKVRSVYESGGFVIKEQALLDGNGDGRGTSRPSRPDIEGGDRFFLTLSNQASEFD